MELVDIYNLYLDGQKVVEPWEGDVDFEVVLMPEEFEYDWRIIELPLDVVATDIDLSFAPNPGCEPEEEKERFAYIEKWAAEYGGIDEALRIRPPTIKIDDIQAFLLDGRHRLVLANAKAITEVPVLVGIPEGFVPEAGIHFPAVYRSSPTATSNSPTP